MTEINEIAYAAASNRLCLLTGTGFSKAMTKNKAPSWQDLLEELCDLLPDGKEWKKKLFHHSGDKHLSLEEIAQIISIQLSSNDLNIYDEVANIIKKISLNGDNTEIAKFCEQGQFDVITTNYDKLFEEIAGKDACQSTSPGLPIPKSSSKIRVHHVHGSIDFPINMVVTSENYFDFANKSSYFSKKLSTLIHENTVVVLGYSLSDTNLKTIINEYQKFSKDNATSSDIFFISRSSLPQHVKDYYSHCYGIRVIDQQDTHDFFEKLNEQIPQAKKDVKTTLGNIRKVIYEGRTFKPSYLKSVNAFTNIILSITAEGLSFQDQKVVSLLGDIISAKSEFTKETGAWGQYVHLAKWLIHLGKIFEIKNSEIETIYLNAVLRSMTTMASGNVLGYSWHAYEAWKTNWFSLTASNRAMIKKHILHHTNDKDAIYVVNQS